MRSDRQSRSTLAAVLWRLFAFVSAASLLMCVATVAMWAWARSGLKQIPITPSCELWVFPQGVGLWRDRDIAPFTHRQYIATFVRFSRLLIVVGLPPVTWLLVRRLRRAPCDDRCRACGYDLRATPTRCPECGTVPAAGRAQERARNAPAAADERARERDGR